MLLLPIAAIRRSGLPLHPRTPAFYAICGVFGTVVPTTTIFYVAPHVGAGFLAITMTRVPLLTYGASILPGSTGPPPCA